MTKPSIMNVVPNDISKQDSIDNQTQAFLVAVDDILNNKCKMMTSKNSYLDRKRNDVERIILPKGYKIL